jgi:hypothetical protein
VNKVKIHVLEGKMENMEAQIRVLTVTGDKAMEKQQEGAEQNANKVN